MTDDREALLAENARLREELKWSRQTSRNAIVNMSGAVERADRAEADANRLADALKAAITLASQVEIFVKSKEQINRPSGVAWFDEEVEKLCAALAEHDKGEPT